MPVLEHVADLGIECGGGGRGGGGGGGRSAVQNDLQE